MVFFNHVGLQWTAGPIPTGPLYASASAQGRSDSIFGQGGPTGVGFFFILSGFVLAWSARSSDTTWSLWRRRIAKIYPSHLLNFTVVVLLFTTVSGISLNKGQVILNLLLLHAWVPSFTTVFSVNPMAWSLSCELFFYFTFPLWVRAVARIRPERLWAWAGMVVALVFLVPVLADLVVGDRMMMPGMAERMWFIELFPPVRMLEFVFGILLARIVATGRSIPLGLGGSVAFAISAYAVASLFPSDFSIVAIMVLPLGLVIAAAARADMTGWTTPLARRGVVWLGEVSFAFYLWQYAVFAYGHRWLGGAGAYSTTAAIGMIAVYFVITLAISALSYHLFERPIYRRIAAPRRTSPPRVKAAVG